MKGLILVTCMGQVHHVSTAHDAFESLRKVLQIAVACTPPGLALPDIPTMCSGLS